MSSKISKASSEETNNLIFDLVVRRLANSPLKIIDIGCGSGFLLNKLWDFYKSKGWSPDQYLSGIDINLSSYASEAPAKEVDLNLPLIESIGSYDLILCLEVLEHSRRPYTLLDDFYKMLNDNGEIICSVPNIGNMNSRLKYLFKGGFQMYFGPSVEAKDAGKLSGHINPLPIQYWIYGLRTANFKNIQYFIDRRKNSSLGWLILLLPFMWLGNYLMHIDQKKYSFDLYVSNKEMLSQVNSLKTLVGRTLIFVANKSR